MSRLKGSLKALVQQRLTAAAEEIFELFERTTAEYEEELCRHRKLLDAVFKPQVQLHRADVQQLLSKEGPPKHQERSPSLDQKDPPELPHIEEEHEELWTSQEGEQLQEMETEEAAVKFTVTLMTEDDAEKKPQSLKLVQTGENRGAEFVNTEAAVETRGGPEPARSSDPGRHLQPDTRDKMPQTCGTENAAEPKTDDPSPVTQLTPSPVTLLTPRPATALTPSPATQLTPSPVTPLNPRPATLLTPSPATLLTPRPATALTPSPATALTPSPATALTPRPVTLLTPRPVTPLNPRTVMLLIPRTMTQLTQSPVTPLTPSPVTPLTSIPATPLTPRPATTSESDTDDSSDWGDTTTPQSDLNPVQNDEEPGSDLEASTEKTTSPEDEGELQNHDSKRETEKSFSCSFCCERFSRRGALSSHIRTHKGEKPFPCSVCGTSFKSRGYLTSHMLTHTGERPFSCSVCGRGFTQQGALKTHLRVHSQSQCISCTVCLKKYKNKRCLIKHMRRHLPDESSRDDRSCSDVCSAGGSQQV